MKLSSEFMILQRFQLVWKLPLIETISVNIVSFQNKSFFKKLDTLYFHCHIKYISDFKEAGLFPFFGVVYYFLAG